MLPNLDPAAVAARIEELRKQLGARVTILGHHYQDDTVIKHVDIRGDSLELARKVEDIASEHIVFCGVYFMAESAALLARPGQKVHLPEMSANCVMAQMAPADLVEAVLKKCNATRKVIPLTYVNSSVAVKGVTGKFGGAVCTSANATKMMEWALKQGDAVLFLPDKNLGWNTADLLGLPEDSRHMLSIRKRAAEMDMGAVNVARLILWPGCCAIHARFNVQQVESRRKENPGCRVVVHPESSPAVVAKADAAGSTSFIIKYVAAAKPGETIVIGTEINLVERLAEQYKETVKIVPLLESECSHMDRTKPLNLQTALESIADPANPAWPSCVVTVDPGIAANAKLCLDRMLKEMQ
ncbi:Quinolinate synthase A [uncultured delta proteobacterium]|uniref:quinolinate synthase n=1 Tax=uncultured delta proteobacterium TaxID=34034 RepID=A0A212J7D4_9DELT|nr:Quinolinate synthase A [uncultured delta proteobacterium]